MNSNSPSTMKTNCIYSLKYYISRTDGKLGNRVLPRFFDQVRHETI